MGEKTTRLKMSFDDKSSKTINHCNPTCQDANMKDVADILDALTSKNLAKSSRIDETVLSEEAEDGG